MTEPRNPREMILDTGHIEDREGFSLIKFHTTMRGFDCKPGEVIRFQEVMPQAEGEPLFGAADFTDFLFPLNNGQLERIASIANNKRDQELERLRNRVAELEKANAELKEKAWKYDDLCK